MGQKVNPVGMRVGVIRGWDSTWFSQREYADYLIEDINVRKLLDKEFKAANNLLNHISNVQIEKTGSAFVINVTTSRPGEVLGQDGKLVQELSKKIAKLVGNKEVKINVLEVKNPDLDATLLAKSMAEQLENRASFRVVQKKIMQRAMKAGAKGVKTMVSGRLAGADIARSEGYSEGVVPLHTLRADIDYGFAEAHTTFGRLGCKVWLCRGEILASKEVKPEVGEDK